MIFPSHRKLCSQTVLIRVSLWELRQRRGPSRCHGRCLLSLCSRRPAEARSFQSFSHGWLCKSRIFKRGTFKPTFNMRPGNGKEREISPAIPCRCQPRGQLVCKYSCSPSFSPLNNHETQNLKPGLQRRSSCKRHFN